MPRIDESRIVKRGAVALDEWRKDDCTCDKCNTVFRSGYMDLRYVDAVLDSVPPAPEWVLVKCPVCDHSVEVQLEPATLAELKKRIEV